MLWVAIFVSNAAVLILEIVGARALIPFLGSSVDTWAGIISAVILGLAIGYWGGGAFADRHAARVRELASLSLAAAGLITIVLWSGSDALAVLGLALVPYVGPAVAAALLSIPLLLLPSIFLAATSPLIAKLLLSSLDTSATTVGRISAVAAVGSVTGSLGVALVLVPYLGSFAILMSTGAALVVVALFMVHGSARTVVLVCALAGVISGVTNVVFADSLGEMTEHTLVADVDSRYSRIIVTDEIHEERTLRLVRTSPYGIQCGSEVHTDGSVEKKLLFPYLRAFDIARLLVPASESVLVLGGCNYSYPQHVAHTWGARVDAIEIDSQMTEIAKQWFGFVPSATVRPIHMDGRLFLRTATTTYDVIIVDAFGVPLTVPFELITAEAFTELNKRLNDDGVVVMNVVSSVTGPGDTYAASIVQSVQAAFPHVGVYQLTEYPLHLPQNLLIIASRMPLPPNNQTRVYPHAEVLYPVDLALFARKDAFILTDDYAPTEALARPLRHELLKIGH